MVSLLLLWLLFQVEDANSIERPYVGVHVRRTDKIGTEAAYHGIEEYMGWVAEYFDKYVITSSGSMSVQLFPE